jgi:hypothetical protein
VTRADSAFSLGHWLGAPLRPLDLGPARALRRGNARPGRGGHLSPPPNYRSVAADGGRPGPRPFANLGQLRFQPLNFFFNGNYFAQLLDS